jgi:predicted alpha/beta hydrolase family esterase
MSAFLIIHGLENVRPEGHWHRILTSQLRRAGHTVVYPQLPQPDAPILSEWLSIVDAELHMLKEAGFDEVRVVCHSLGCVTWLHYIEKFAAPLKISQLLLVAPADPKLLTAAPTFQTIQVNAQMADRLHQICPDITLIASESDPWLPDGIEQTYGNPLLIHPTIWEGAGHISMADGFGEWIGVFNWFQDRSNVLTEKHS